MSECNEAAWYCQDALDEALERIAKLEAQLTAWEVMLLQAGWVKDGLDWLPPFGEAVRP